MKTTGWARVDKALVDEAKAALGARSRTEAVHIALRALIENRSFEQAASGRSASRKLTENLAIKI